MVLGLLLVLLLLLLLVPLILFVPMLMLMLLVLPIISSRSTRFGLVAPLAPASVVVTVSKLHLLFLSPVDDGVEGNLAKASSSSCSTSSCFAPDHGSGGGDDDGTNSQFP